MMTFKEFLNKYYDFPPQIRVEDFHRGHAEALVRYIDEVVVPALQEEQRK